MKAKGHVVWFFRQKKDCLNANQSGIEKLYITVFSRLPSLRRLQATPPLQTSLLRSSLLLERFSENFDYKAETCLIFFLGMHWFQKCPRSNDDRCSNFIEIKNDNNSKWKLVKIRWNPKFGLSTMKVVSWPQGPWKGVSDFFSKILLHFLNQCIKLRKMCCSSTI